MNESNETKEPIPSSFLDQIQEAVVLTDLTGCIIGWNRGAENLFGYQGPEILGRHVSLLYGQEDRDNVCREVISQIQGQGRHELEKQVQRKNGEVFWVHSSLSLLRDEGGKPTGMVGISLDVTSRKQAEEAARQGRQLEAVGQLAGGVAHDFNNLLTVILGYCQVLLQHRSCQDPEYAALRDIQGAAQRAAHLTRQLLAYGRRQIFIPTILNLQDRLQALEGTFRQLLGQDIHYDFHADADLGKIKADPGQMDQVFLTLVANAREGMPGGGILTIEADKIELSESPAPEDDGFRPGPYVRVCLRDNGHGLDEESRRRLFEPFFRSREPGETAADLGLATVYGIIRQSGGHITVASTPGQGTTFTIYLPRLPEALLPAASPAALKTANAATTILLVEDEDQVRQLTSLVLRQKGYQVLEATTASAALELASGQRVPIHLLVSDVVMPGMSGTQLAERLRESRPELKVVFLSGYTEEALGQSMTGFTFLQKPFTPASLIQVVGRMLENETITD